MITTIQLFNSWTNISFWGNHGIVFLTEFMMECFFFFFFFEVIDDIKNKLQGLTCAT